MILYYIVLYCIILYYIVLYCIILYYIVLYCITPCHIILTFTILDIHMYIYIPSRSMWLIQRSSVFLKLLIVRTIHVMSRPLRTSCFEFAKVKVCLSNDWDLKKALLPHMGSVKDKHGVRESLAKVNPYFAQNGCFRIGTKVDQSQFMYTYIDIDLFYAFIYLLVYLCIYLHGTSWNPNQRI